MNNDSKVVSEIFEDDAFRFLECRLEKQPAKDGITTFCSIPIPSKTN